MLKKLICFILINFVSLAKAQETGSDFRFQPPRPPPLDPATDFDDMDEDTMEMGDDGMRPPPPPPTPPSYGGPTPEFNPPSIPTNRGGYSARSGDGKIHFQVVEGEFLEKGKKRGRGQKLRASGSASD